MFLTAAVPCRNAERTLERTIRSLLAEERRADEILIVDDASTDGSVEIAEQFRRGGAPVRIVATPPPHSGATLARRIAVREAKGDWIAFMDADDEAEPFRLREYLAALERAPNAIGISSPPRYLRPDGTEDSPIYPTDAGDIAALEPVYNVFHVAFGMMLRDAAADALDGMAEMIIEDWAIALELVRRGPLINILDPATRIHTLAGSRSARLRHDEVRAARRGMLARWFACAEAEVASHVRERAREWVTRDLLTDRELIVWGGGRGGDLIEELLPKESLRTGTPLPDHPRAIAVSDAIARARCGSAAILLASRASRALAETCTRAGILPGHDWRDVSPAAWGLAWDQASIS